MEALEDLLPLLFGVGDRLRLVEAALTSTSVRTLLTGAGKLGPLGTLSARLAHPTDPDAIVVDYVDTDESSALIAVCSSAMFSKITRSTLTILPPAVPDGGSARGR